MDSNSIDPPNSPAGKKAPVQQRRPLPAAETGRSCWGCGQQDARAAQGTTQPLGAATRVPYSARLAQSTRAHPKDQRRKYAGFYFARHLKSHSRGWIRTAAEPTAACGRNREARLGQRSAFSKPCQGSAETAASATRKTRRTVRQTKDKRKSDDPCRWVIAFLVPCGTGRVNDKKVNEENSKVRTKACAEPKKAL